MLRYLSRRLIASLITLLGQGNGDSAATLEASGDLNWNGQVTLTYDYAVAPPAPATTPGVPEPAAWALMLAGFGLAGAQIRGRRRRLPA